jgi:hypothetical protein
MPGKEMIQTDFPITDDLTAYRGRWVAVRDGKVIASGIDPIELQSRPEVAEGDLLFLVPSLSPQTLLL